MKYKIVTFEGTTETFVIVSHRALLYCLASGYKTWRAYQGHEVDSQRGRWAAEFKFGHLDDAKQFCREHLTTMTEVEEVTKEVEKEVEG